MPLAASKPVVAVSVAPLAGVVERLAGNAVETAILVPAGADVETYAPTPGQVERLERAALVVLVGSQAMAIERRYFDRWLERHPEVPRLTLASDAGIRDADRLEDPHLWMSARRVRALAGPLAARLAELAPAEADAVAQRARRFEAEIATLDRELEQRFSTLRGARFLVYHPAFGVLARDYGLVQVSLEVEGKEPTPRQLAERLLDARHRRYPALLVLAGTPRRRAESLAREIGARLVVVDPLARDWLPSLRRIGAEIAAAAVRETP